MINELRGLCGCQKKGTKQLDCLLRPMVSNPRWPKNHWTARNSWDKPTFLNPMPCIGTDKSSSDMAQNFLIEVNSQELQVFKEARNYFTCQRPLHVACLPRI